MPTKIRTSLAAAAVLLVVGCGAPEDIATSNDNGYPFPSARNFYLWQSHWDNEKNWIIASYENQHTPLSRSDAERNLLRALVKGALATNAAKELSPTQIQSLGAFLRRSLDVESLPQITGAIRFTRVNLEAMRAHPFFKKIWRTQTAVNEEYRLLHSLPDVAWVEPSLTTRLTQDSAGVLNSPYESATGEPWRRVGMDAARAAVRTQGLTSRPAVVAVLDTGVDIFHPDLRGQIWENPRENANGIDDDKNDYADDICGIDATTPISPATPQTNPGVADLGGPGSECPVFAEEDPRYPGFIVQQTAEGCGHGTHISGIIAGWPDSTIRTEVCGKPIPDNYQDVSALAPNAVYGVCPECRLLPVRVIDTIIRPDGRQTNGMISDMSQIRALNYILSLRDVDSNEHVVDVVNMSIGKYFPSRSIFYTLRQIVAANIVVVAAAGNDDTDTPSYPGAYEDAVGVCALDVDSNIPTDNSLFGKGKFAKAVFSNFGYWVDVCAPGTRIRSAIPSGPDSLTRHEEKDGTSQATPFVAGILGFIRAYQGRSGSGQVHELLQFLKRSANGPALYDTPYNRHYVQSVPKGGSVHLLGAGMVDAHMLLRLLQGDPTTGAAPGVTNPLGSTELEGCVMATTGHSTPVKSSWLATLLIFGGIAWLGLRKVASQVNPG